MALHAGRMRGRHARSVIKKEVDRSETTPPRATVKVLYASSEARYYPAPVAIRSRSMVAERPFRRIADAG